MTVVFNNLDLTLQTAFEQQQQAIQAFVQVGGLGVNIVNVAEVLQTRDQVFEPLGSRSNARNGLGQILTQVIQFNRFS